MSALSEQLNPALPLTRFLLSKSQFSARKSRVKPDALLPQWNENSGRFETSCFRTDGLSDAEIWSLGDREVALPSDRTMHARGDFPVSAVVESNLEFDLNENPKRHGDIIGWATEKDERKSQSQELASRATLMLP